MKKLFVFSILFAHLFVYGQTSVFDCSAFTNHPTQTEINAFQDHFGACITLGGNQPILISNNDVKNVYAANEIHLTENFHAGAFTGDGQTHLKITNNEKSLDVVVMNYTDLNSVLRYKKFELGVKLPTDLQLRVDHFLHNEGTDPSELNPFVDWNVDVEATFFHPLTGAYKIVDGYYTRDYSENSITNDWDDVGTAFPFRVRYAPPQNGKWVAMITIKINNQVEYTSDWFGFNVIESGDPGYVFVHPNQRNLMRGDRMIFPVGHNFMSPYQHNIPWGGICSDPLDCEYLGHNLFSPSTTFKATNTVEWEAYRNKIEDYFQQGGRYIRTLQTPWGSLIEFEKKGNYYDRLHYAWEQDKLLDLCEQYDALMEFNMLIHDQFDVLGDKIRFDWDKWDKYESVPYYDEQDPYPVYCYNDNPSATNPKKPRECLTNENDLIYHEQRTRYYIARYGYSTKIYDFEMLSEPFNIGSNPLIYTKKPYEDPSNPEHQAHVDAVYTYHTRLSKFIKENMNHTEHLVGMDCSINTPDPSLALDNIDIIGVNYYANSPSKYIISKPDESNNEYETDENTIAKAVVDLLDKAGKAKPIIFSEFGDGEEFGNCSSYSGHYVDAMSAGFTGACGFNSWVGGESNFNLWTSTIRAQNHMNSDFVINTLSDGNGNWIQGRQKSYHKNYKKDTNEEAVELQYYISNDKEKIVGYIRNRTYNSYTGGDQTSPCDLIRIGESTTNYVKDLAPINTRKAFEWNDIKFGKRLKVFGGLTTKKYGIIFYPFTEDYYNYYTTKYSNPGGKLRLEFPMLTPIREGNPVIWFTASKLNNNNLDIIDSNNYELINDQFDERISLNERDDIIPEGIKVFPNPFSDYFIVESTKEDVLVLQNQLGETILKQVIHVGENKIFTPALTNGMYLIKFQFTNFNYKLFKL